MATFTSTQAGAWSSLNTWGASGPPGAADTAIVLHAVTYDATLVHTAGVTVRGAGVLSLQADLKLSGTAILRCDVSGGVCGRIVAVGAPRQILFMGGTTYQIQVAGTAAAHGVLKGEDATNTLTIDGYANVDVFKGGGMIDATFADFTNCGSATVPALKAYSGQNNVGPYRLIDCTFTNCGRLYFNVIGPNAPFTLTRVKHLSPPGASNSLYMSVFQGAAPNAGIDRSITACAFDAYAEVYAANGVVGRDIYAGNEFYSHFDGNPDLQRIFYNKPVGTKDSVAYCTITDWYIFEADPTAAANNAHWITPTPGHVPNPYVFSGVIFDGNQPTIRPQNGDCYLNNNQGSGTCIMRNCIVLPTAWGPTEAGTLMTLGGNTSTTFAFEHNTYCCGYQGAAVQETYAGYAGMVTSFRGNFAWNDPTVARGYKLYDSGYALATGNDNVPDLVTAANCDYNGGWNVSSGGSNGKGYHALEFSSGSPGAHDVDVNPFFVDYTRDFLKWDASLGGAGTVASAQARLKADPTLIGSALIPYVRAGFVPQNPLLATTAHDGTTIGAMPYAAPPGDYGLFPPPVASGLPGVISDAFTVVLKAGFNPGGTVTITPHTAGLAGTFTPATVTLSNTTRQASFTFTPTVATIGTATLTVTNSGTLINPNPVTYATSYPALDLTRFNADMLNTGRNYPQTPLALDTTDHYDPVGVFENVRAYTNDPSWDKQIGFALARWSGYAEDWGGGINDVYAHNEGLYQNYLRTGDPRSRDLALIMALWPNFAGSSYDLNIAAFQGSSREIAFTLRNQIIAERLGYAHRTRTDDWVTTALGHLDQWSSPNKPWATYSRPFMFGFTASALAWYWDRYRDARIPPAIKAACDWFWENAWDPPSHQFYYTAEDTLTWVSDRTTLQASPAPTTTSFAGGAGLSAVDDAYKGMWIIRAKLGVLDEQGRICTGYDGTTKVFTFGNPWNLTAKSTYAWQTGESICVADDIKTTVQASPAPTTTSFAIGGTGLSAVNDYYRFAAMVVMPSGSTYQCWSYNGTTKVVTTRPGVALPAPLAAGTQVTLSRYQKNGFNLGGFTGGTGIGSGGALNLMVAQAYYWYYWYSVLTGQRDNTYRARGDDAQQGYISPSTQKLYNEAFKYSFWGLKWRSLGDSLPAAATALTLTAPSPASGKANAPSGLFFAALAAGGVSTPVTVTPADGGGGGVFNPATVVLTTDRPSAHFRYIPPASKDGQSVTITITNNGGLTNPAGRSYAVAGTAPLATGYTITATGAPRGPNQYSAPFTVALTPAGAVPPRAADAHGCLITFTCAGGALYPLKNVTIAADRPTALIAFQPDTAAATNTARLVNDAGLPDAPNIAYTAGTALPLATSYTLTAPVPASGPVGVPSAPFTVALPAGTAVAKGSFYWLTNVVPNAGTGGGTFAQPQQRLLPTQFSTTFVYTPSTAGTKTIATTNDSTLTNPASVLYNATTSPATGYTLTAPSPATGTVGVASGNFAVTLVPTGATSADVVITPSAGGGGGTFAPTTLTLNTTAPSGTFKYTPASAGTKTITATNNGGLVNPAGVSYSATSATSVATGYSLTAPSPATGTVGVASGNFAVTLVPAGGTSAAVTITPTAGPGNGTFSPSTVTLSTATPTATFKFTPAVAGARTITTTNSGTLTEPPGVTYTAADPPTTATGYTLTAPVPASGQVGIPSGLFTVALTPTGASSLSFTIAPSAGTAGGSFVPTTVTLATATPVATFRFVPSSAGAATITTTNTGNFANPAGVTYNATPAPTPTPTPTTSMVLLRIRPRTQGRIAVVIRAH